MYSVWSNQHYLSVPHPYSLSTNSRKDERFARRKIISISFIDTRIGIGISKYQGNQKTHTATVPASEFDKRRMFVEIPYIGEQTRSLKKHIN